MVNLPDVNVLIALSWRNHIHHSPALSWFSSWRENFFATCPITESGFVRLSMNPHVVGEAVSFQLAMSALKVYLDHPKHRFWAADEDFYSLVRDLPVSGYRQTTDAYLLALAVKNGGRLVSFDRRLAELVEKKNSSHTCT
ncbi:MAG TPA: PIN domain-containing protein [Sediminispirochaeta sp.]|nr:PIN domain-containing protein [Sediminispirochaeta sp.]